MEISESKEMIEAGRKLFAGNCDFVAGVTSLDNMIPATITEVAFAGRSNVGKSSLINALTGRKALARTSHTPGRTQQINFFNLGDKIHIVDLPGYGYARASKKAIASWNELIRLYLKGRQTLRRVCLLIDLRHGVKPVDLEIMKLLDDSAVAYQVVLTKSDKVKKEEKEKRILEIKEMLKKHPAALPSVLTTSSVKKSGIPELHGVLASIALES